MGRLHIGGTSRIFLLIALALFVVIFVISQWRDEETLLVSEGDASIRFRVSDRMLFDERECITVQWEVDGIREVYLMTEPGMGTDTRDVCGPFPAFPGTLSGAVWLRIVHVTGNMVDYPIAMIVLTRTPWFWVLCMVTAAAFGLGIRSSLTTLIYRARTRLTHVVQFVLARPALVVALFTLFGAGLRLYHLSQESLWFDEGVMYHIAAMPTLAEVVEANANNNSGPPLFAVMLHAVTRFDSSVETLRSLPLIASVLCIPSLYLLARQFMGRNGAYLAAILVATSETQVRFAQEVREYTFAVLLTILILLAFVRYLRRPAFSTRSALIVVCALGLFTHYSIALLILALNLAFLLKWWQDNRPTNALFGWAAIQGVLAICVLGVYLVALRFQFSPDGFASDDYLRQAYGDGSIGSLYRLAVINTLDFLRFTYSGDLFIALALIGIGVFLVDRKIVNLMTLFVIFPVCVLVAFMRWFPYQGERQVIFLTVPLMIAAAMAFEYALTHIRGGMRIAIILAVIVSIINSLDLVRRMLDEYNPSQTELAMEYISQHYEDGDTILIHYNTYPVFSYYAAHSEFAALPAPIVANSAYSGQYLADVPAVLEREGRVWILLSDCFDHCAQSWTALMSRSARSFEWPFDGGRTFLFLLPARTLDVGINPT